jgi:hypothetical protein
LSVQILKLSSTFGTRGGPNWIKEFRDFQAEEAAKWSIVKGKKLTASFAESVGRPILSGANVVPIRKKGGPDSFHSKSVNDRFSGRTSSLQENIRNFL